MNIQANLVMNNTECFEGMCKVTCKCNSSGHWVEWKSSKAFCINFAHIMFTKSLLCIRFLTGIAPNLAQVKWWQSNYKYYHQLVSWH